MKKLIYAFFLTAITSNAFAFEILALGTSNTNCKNANAAYTNTLNDLVTKSGIQAQVINGGVVSP